MGMGGAGVHAYALTPRTWLQIWAVQLKIVPKLGSSTRATHAALKSASGEPHVQYNLKQRVRGIGDVSPTQESRTIQTISQTVLVTVATTTSRRTRRSATSTSLNSFRLPSTRSVACTRIRLSFCTTSSSTIDWVRRRRCSPRATPFGVGWDGRSMPLCPQRCYVLAGFRHAQRTALSVRAALLLPSCCCYSLYL